ncbi:5-(carboxyamino)imidazole ribonucleotide mutase [Helicobacter zhangjianzhongii]|uniref:5-(Carboxyamino)imidazole ribonucleotide mutase n=1 Tax=Helicobacter zhangjianzhongii TaxID=2974574 RepID=A0ACC6FUG1_9HELI|nr:MULTISPECIES: 5-(carboxyamino)imidazole ribonucleotide mutase [unclassified Helicobacter]MDL0080905.1 5-(carboxyamino)imidazole ribonucleotide mutase [Helicobacter sp. CPD2-1]MDL0082939.1 5-(carboxyamino)imidazole ribonucleotide mutase [Helicobacter sp. XJK30-2]
MDFVSVIMGSKSDYEIMRHCLQALESFSIPYEVLISSAHRSPDRTKDYIKQAESKGAKVFICAAGMAAHLAGAVCAQTTKPVIGVPLSGGVLDGLDALLSTVQMPGGMPVACMAVGKAGALNAAYMAVQILAIGDKDLAEKLLADRAAKVVQIEQDSKSIEVRLPNRG